MVHKYYQNKGLFEELKQHTDKKTIERIVKKKITEVHRKIKAACYHPKGERVYYNIFYSNLLNYEDLPTRVKVGATLGMEKVKEIEDADIVNQLFLVLDHKYRSFFQDGFDEAYSISNKRADIMHPDVKRVRDELKRFRGLVDIINDNHVRDKNNEPLDKYPFDVELKDSVVLSKDFDDFSHELLGNFHQLTIAHSIDYEKAVFEIKEIKEKFDLYKKTIEKIDNLYTSSEEVCKLSTDAQIKSLNRYFKLLCQYNQMKTHFHFISNFAGEFGKLEEGELSSLISDATIFQSNYITLKKLKITDKLMKNLPRLSNELLGYFRNNTDYLRKLEAFDGLLK